MARSQLFSMTLSAVSFLTVSLSIQAISAFGGVPAVAADAVQQQQADIGKLAPDFTLPDAEGKKHALSDYKGKYVVLEWVNFGCPFVRKHYDSHNMQKLQAQYTDKGVVWLTICSSAPNMQGHMTGDELKNKLKSEEWKGTAYLLDEDGTVGRKYGAKTTPDMFVLDKSGELVYSGAIDNKPTPYQSDLAGAKNYLKAALDEIMGGKQIAVSTTKSYGCSVKYANQ